MMTETHLGPYLLGPNDTPENGIYTGDARELAEAIPDESVDLIFTDPPWGVNYAYPGEYSDTLDECSALVQWISATGTRVLKPGAFAFCYQGTKHLQTMYPLFPSGSRLFADCKTFIQLKSLPVEFAVDYIVFWQRPGSFDLRGMFRDWHLASTSRTCQKSRDTAVWLPSGVNIPPPRPLESCKYVIEQMSSMNGIVLDFFIGSGTTAVAAKMLGRRYLAFEIDPATADLARERVRNTQPPLFVPEPEQLPMLETEESIDD